jgi:hypothetical protein
MGRFRRRLLGWACLAFVVMNVTAVICGGIAGSDTRMPCCISLGDNSPLPTLEPCCAAEQRQQADPAGRATNAAAAQPAVDAATLLGVIFAPTNPTLPRHYSPVDRFGSPPDAYLLFSVLLI